jgi:hypothetical protein
MKKYTVNTPIKHDDKDFAVEENIELSAKDAKPLLAIGAIVEVAPVDSKATKT